MGRQVTVEALEKRGCGWRSPIGGPALAYSKETC